MIIAGSRVIDCDGMVDLIVKDLLRIPGQITTVISGNARGPDRMGERWAKANNIPVEIHKPDWSIGKHAGLIRNRQMAMVADAAIVIWDGKSTGSIHMYHTMEKLVKPVVLYRVSVEVLDEKTIYQLGEHRFEKANYQSPPIYLGA